MLLIFSTFSIIVCCNAAYAEVPAAPPPPIAACLSAFNFSVPRPIHAPPLLSWKSVNANKEQMRISCQSSSWYLTIQNKSTGAVIRDFASN